MTLPERFSRALEQLPLIAILRGLTPQDAPAIGDALVRAGFGLLEVPLNSPRALDSISLLRQAHPDVLVGAGTVLTPAQVRAVHAAGGQLLVSPNFDAQVVRSAVELGMISLPGILTPTEAFAALAAGAHGLKLFPAEIATPAVIKALRAVLPDGTRLFPVGGIGAADMGAWKTAGAVGVGIGSALYRPGKSADAVYDDAMRFVAAWRGE